jgi:DNA phosphorothioation-associated DGQHR protein 1
MNFKELYAIKISQPLCDFYLTSMKAIDLMKVAFSEQLQYHDELGRLQGSQRKVDTKRLSEIGRFIDSVEMSFPSSIIIAANYNEDGELVDDVLLRWDVEEIEHNMYKITIPKEIKLAAIIDGQHRLLGFGDKYIENKDRLNVDLPVSIFFDLTNPYQAFLFATINGNQRKVDKSLALEQFGFNVEDEPQNSWSPEKLAVYFTRLLNFKDSPIKGHVKIAPMISKQLKNQIFLTESEWIVSTATIVDGILNLISSNPKRDRVEMAQENIFGKRSRKMVASFKDKSPLRKYFLEKDDDFILGIITNYLAAVKKTVWVEYDPKSYIFKTVGVQALFDLLKKILQKQILKDESEFITFLSGSLQFDFSNSVIQASGIGRKDIRNALYLGGDLISESDLNSADLMKINALRPNLVE